MAVAFVTREPVVASALTVGVDGRYLQDKFDGIGRYVYGLLSGLAVVEGNHRIVVFRDPSLPNSRFDLDALTHSGRVTLRDIAIPLYSARELWEWPRALRAMPVDVFHSPYFWSPLILPCPLVATVHDMIFDRYPRYIPGWRYLLPYKVTSRLALRKASRVIAVSQATRRDITTYAGTEPEKIVTVLEAAETLFRPVTDAAALARARATYDLPDRFILALGARRPHKNIPRLVAAFARVASEVPHDLVLAGSIDRRFADDAPPEIARLRQAGRVREIGRVADADLPALYSLADLFVQPSIIEGFGLPVLEAMACGCPVACSAASSLSEVAGDAAVLFDPHAEHEIVGAMRQALTSDALRAFLAERGRRRAAQFTWERAARESLSVYRSAAGREG